MHVQVTLFLLLTPEMHHLTRIVTVCCDSFKVWHALRFYSFFVALTSQPTNKQPSNYPDEIKQLMAFMFSEASERIQSTKQMPLGEK